MKIHKILEGPFPGEYDDDPIELIVYAELFPDVFESVAIITEDISFIWDIQKHMARPTLEPFKVDYVH